MRSLRIAFRSLAKTPTFTAVAIGLLAIGIGANAVIFSAFDAVLLRPLAARHPEQLVRAAQTRPQLGTRSQFPFSFYQELRDHSRTIGPVFAEAEYLQPLTDPAPAEQIRIRGVTPEFFDALGVPALLGRTLTPADADETSGAVPAVLSYGFWMRRFAGDPRTLQRTVAIGARRFVIVGVMPREFNGTSAETAPEVRVPVWAMKLLVANRFRNMNDFSVEIVARLKPGVTRERAEEECKTIWQRWLAAQSKGRPRDLADRILDEPFELDSIEYGVSILRDRFGGALRLLIAAAALLQLLLCVNLAGLLLARGAARREEMAVRLALGATRTRLLRQLMLESSILAAFGCAGGLAVAYVFAPLLARYLPPLRDPTAARLSLDLSFAPDWRVLAFSFALSAFTALLFGLVPAAAASRTSLDAIIRTARSGGRWRGRQAMLVFQIALCAALLSGAGLLVRTFRELRGLNPGFDYAHIVTFTVETDLARYTPEQSKTLIEALETRVREMPGVLAVGHAARPLMRGTGYKSTVVLPGRQMTQADFLNSSSNSISPDYFAAMGMRVVAGRNLTSADEPPLSPIPVVVNEAFARHFFPGVNATGRLIGEKGDRIIVGVVSDAKYRSLREPLSPVYYTVQTPGPFVLHVRTASRPESIIEPVRKAMAALAPGLPIVETHTMEEEIDASAAPERLTAALASLFAAVAALVAGIGVYGLFAYTVTQRQREIAVRMALGARPGNIGRMIVFQAAWIAAFGAASGLLAARAMAPLMRSLLYDVPPSDPASFAAAAAFVALVAAAAVAPPAWRAARLQPAATLRG